MLTNYILVNIKYPVEKDISGDVAFIGVLDQFKDRLLGHYVVTGTTVFVEYLLQDGNRLQLDMQMHL